MKKNVILITGLSRDHTKVKRRRQPERQKVKGLVSKKETKEINFIEQLRREVRLMV